MYILWIVFVAAGIIVLYRSRDADEPWLALKLIGYYVLGAFYIRLNALALPVGFVVGMLLLLAPKTNRGAKRGAVVLGLALMLLGWLLR